MVSFGFDHFGHWNERFGQFWFCTFWFVKLGVLKNIPEQVTGTTPVKYGRLGSWWNCGGEIIQVSGRWGNQPSRERGRSWEILTQSRPVWPHG